MHPKNVADWEYSLIAGGYATMKEIRYEMSVWDVLDLIEVMTVKESNNILAREAVEERNKRQ